MCRPKTRKRAHPLSEDQESSDEVADQYARSDNEDAVFVNWTRDEFEFEFEFATYQNGGGIQHRYIGNVLVINEEYEDLLDAAQHGGDNENGIVANPNRARYENRIVPAQNRGGNENGFVANQNGGGNGNGMVADRNGGGNGNGMVADQNGGGNGNGIVAGQNGGIMDEAYFISQLEERLNPYSLTPDSNGLH